MEFSTLWCEKANQRMPKPSLCILCRLAEPLWSAPISGQKDGAMSGSCLISAVESFERAALFLVLREESSIVVSQGGGIMSCVWHPHLITAKLSRLFRGPLGQEKANLDLFGGLGLNFHFSGVWDPMSAPAYGEGQAGTIPWSVCTMFSDYPTHNPQSTSLDSQRFQLLTHCHSSTVFLSKLWWFWYPRNPTMSHHLCCCSPITRFCHLWVISTASDFFLHFPSCASMVVFST